MNILKALAAFFVVSSAPALAKRPLPSLLQNLTILQYQEHVAKLSGYAEAVDGQFIPDRFSQAGLGLTRTYLKRVLNSAGFSKIEREPFSVKGNRLGRWGSGVNYFVEIPGCVRPNEFIVVGAHYDSAGMKIRGANDNASGAAAVLSMAEAFMASGVCPERTLRFMLYDGEELGYYGSVHHLTRAAERGEDIQLFINLDMIGYPLTHHRSLFYDGREWNDELRALMERAAFAMPEEIRMEPTVAPRMYRSDHSTGALIGFPAVGLVENVRTSMGKIKKISPNYHTTKDRIWEMDMEYAFGVVQYLASLTVTAANSKERWMGQEERERQIDFCQSQLKAKLGI